ncbi:MAG TPA: hypothetical protein GX694_04870 [Actinomycetales bacterium]|nr:hypothetical protein [Actinomycetales bacterium]
MLFASCAVALVAASCAQPEPHVLSEAPGQTSASELTTASSTTEGQPRPGRFIARCATEADGGTPGMTIFTDGSQGVTDHCLRRYYIGVQPAPGALYVPDEDAGTHAPTRESAVADGGWTPAQPRTDDGPLDPLPDADRTADGQDSPVTRDEEADDDLATAPDAPTDDTTPTDPTDPTSPSPEDPTTGEPGTEEPGTEPTTPGDGTTTPPGEPGEPGEPGDGTGSSDPAEPTGSDTPTTTVPTVTESPETPPSSLETSVTSTAPSGPLGSASQFPPLSSVPTS